MDLNKELQSAIEAGTLACIEILEQYKNGFQVFKKSDNSPVTTADMAANKIITKIFTGKSKYPVLSEEGNHKTPEIRAKWDTYWCVDPIDGTRDFTRKTDEFCTCIALIHEEKPILGVLFAPAINQFYFGAQGIGSFKVNLKMKELSELTNENFELNDLIDKSEKLKAEAKYKDKYVMLHSRYHLDEATVAYFDSVRKKKEIETKAVGSAVKIPMIVEGIGNEYTRKKGANYWDVAAGDAIARAAGLSLVSLHNNKPIVYNPVSLKTYGYSIRLE